MTKWCITFSGAGYHTQTSHVVERAPKMGADRVLIYDDLWLVTHRPEFCKKNKWFFDHVPQRGFGWYIWKPFVILDALNRAEDGDIILYLDGDTYPIQDFSILYEECKKQGIVLFEAVGQSNSHWTKRDCFITMGMDEDRFRFAPHVTGRFALFQKGAENVKPFLDDWLKYVCTHSANTIDPSVLAPEYPEFTEHRSDQSVLSNLSYKYGCRLYREADAFGNSIDRDKELYPQIFEQLGGQSSSHKDCQGSAFRNVND